MITRPRSAKVFASIASGRARRPKTVDGSGVATTSCLGFSQALLELEAFDERLEHAVAHADRFEHKVALLLIDLDDFKYVNDTHGRWAPDYYGGGMAYIADLAFRVKAGALRIGCQTCFYCQRT